MGVGQGREAVEGCESVLSGGAARGWGSAAASASATRPGLQHCQAVVCRGWRGKGRSSSSTAAAQHAQQAVPLPLHLSLARLLHASQGLGEGREGEGSSIALCAPLAASAHDARVLIGVEDAPQGIHLAPARLCGDDGGVGEAPPSAAQHAGCSCSCCSSSSHSAALATGSPPPRQRQRHALQVTAQAVGLLCSGEAKPAQHSSAAVHEDTGEVVLGDGHPALPPLLLALPALLPAPCHLRRHCCSCSCSSCCSSSSHALELLAPPAPGRWPHLDSCWRHCSLLGGQHHLLCLQQPPMHPRHVLASGVLRQGHAHLPGHLWPRVPSERQGWGGGQLWGGPQGVLWAQQGLLGREKVGQQGLLGQQRSPLPPCRCCCRCQASASASASASVL